MVGTVSADVYRGSVPATEATLGGIRLGSSVEYMYQVYGSPTERFWAKSYMNQRELFFRYGNGFYILPGRSTIQELYTDRNNGIATPAGITVGVPKTTVEYLYGEADYMNSGRVRYYTTEGKAIDITYGLDTNGILVVKKIHIHYTG